MDEKIINTIIKEANKAFKKKEIPVGCVIVKNGKIISKAHNNKQKTHLCTGHAEILAIEKAEKKLRDWRLNGCSLYVTLEPCKMCQEAIRQARIAKVYFLLETRFKNEDDKFIEYQKLNTDKSAEYKEQLSSFFEDKR